MDRKGQRCTLITLVMITDEKETYLVLPVLAVVEGVLGRHAGQLGDDEAREEAADDGHAERRGERGNLWGRGGGQVSRRRGV